MGNDGMTCDRCGGPREADDECLAVEFGEWADAGPDEMTLCGECERSLAEWIERGHDDDYRGDDDDA